MKRNLTTLSRLFIYLWFLGVVACTSPAPKGHTLATTPAASETKTGIESPPHYSKKPIDDQWTVVTAKVEKVLVEWAGSKSHRLRILDPQWQNELMVWPDNLRLPIQTGRYCTLTILSGSRYDFDGKWEIIHSIEKVVQDGAILMNNTFCEMHGRKMERVLAPIRYGYYGSSYGGIPFTVWNEKFPNGYPCVFGGCVTDTLSPAKCRRYLCPECVSLRERWLKDHHLDSLDDELYRIDDFINR